MAKGASRAMGGAFLFTSATTAILAPPTPNYRYPTFLSYYGFPRRKRMRVNLYDFSSTMAA
jgi:hypothetical protein